MKQIITKSGIKGYQCRLQDNYGSLEEFQDYDANYGLVKKLGYPDASTAWEANPVIQGSINPDDFCIAHEPVKDNGGEGFTPGEWEACKNNDGWPDLPIWTTIDIGNGILQNECVATVWANDKAEANARLICQAPAMYVALKAMSQNYSLLLGSIDDANENDYSLLTEAEAILSRIQLNK